MATEIIKRLSVLLLSKNIFNISPNKKPRMILKIFFKIGQIIVETLKEVVLEENAKAMAIATLYAILKQCIYVIAMCFCLLYSH